MRKKIYIVGFMGCGKTTVGKLLARKMGMPFKDVDSIIEKRENRKISEIFAEQGEEHFRQLEKEEISNLCAGKKAVISGGGGSFCILDNQKEIMQKCTTVYLEAEYSDLEARILGSKNRPLAKDPEKLRELFCLREAQYEKADIRVDITDRSPLEIVEEILAQLG